MRLSVDFGYILHPYSYVQIYKNSRLHVESISYSDSSDDGLTQRFCTHTKMGRIGIHKNRTRSNFQHKDQRYSTLKIESYFAQTQGMFIFIACISRARQTRHKHDMILQTRDESKAKEADIFFVFCIHSQHSPFVHFNHEGLPQNNPPQYSRRYRVRCCCCLNILNWFFTLPSF